MKHKEFAARMRESIQEMYPGATLTDLGSKFGGISHAIVSNYLRGEKMPSIATAIVIAERLNVCVEWLLTGRGPKRPTDSVMSVDLSDLEPGEREAVRATIGAMTAARKEKRSNHK